jgi:hypothetical protein
MSSSNRGDFGTDSFLDYYYGSTLEQDKHLFDGRNYVYWLCHGFGCVFSQLEFHLASRLFVCVCVCVCGMCVCITWSNGGGWLPCCVAFVLAARGRTHCGTSGTLHQHRHFGNFQKRLTFGTFQNILVHPLPASNVNSLTFFATAKSGCRGRLV